jgi:uncharacterized protein YkwD
VCFAAEASHPVALPARKHLHQEESNPNPAKKETHSEKGDSHEDPGARPISVQDFNSNLMQRLLFELTNEERRKAGLPEFGSLPPLFASATAHSSDMASRDFFSHRGGHLFSHTSVSDRVHSAGLSTSAVAENIAMYPVFAQILTRYSTSIAGVKTQSVESSHYSYEEMAARVMQEWMQSPGHRRNILDPTLNYLGTGCAVGMHDSFPYVYCTQDFARLVSPPADHMPRKVSKARNQTEGSM